MNTFYVKKTTKKVPTQIKPIKSVTPSSLSKLSGILTTPAKNLYNIFQYSSGKTREIINFTFDDEDTIKSNKKLQYRVKVRVKSEKKLESKKALPEDGRCLRYIEFKNYHETRFRKKNAFIDKYTPTFIGNFKGKRPASEENKGDLGRREDLFAPSTVYSRPALTYLEKLFRLNQVSIFN